MMNKNDLIQYFNNAAKKRLTWKKRNRYYHFLIKKYFCLIIPEGCSVIELGCGDGDLLHAVKPKNGMGIDFSEEIIEIARKKHPELRFEVQDVEDIQTDEKFDYIILSDLVTSLWDIQKAFQNLKKISHRNTKIIISYYNFLWEPILKFGERISMKAQLPNQNWLSPDDIINLLELENIEIIKSFRKILFPKRFLFFERLLNVFFANLPLINSLCLTNFIIAKLKEVTYDEKSVSIIVPAKNEKGNIENAILRTPKFGQKQEFIFIEGNSSDGTYDEMLRIQKKYNELDIIVTKQTGKGKGNAVREAFEIAKNEILMILDADLTTPPEDLPKFYNALKNCSGEFINGCRLVYPMEKEAMRLLNLLGNKFFGAFFSFLLDQRLKDTLCGTKVLYKEDYLKIAQNRTYFGDFDPFGDFDLLFGASKLNLKIVEIPVRYKDRMYGSTQISRFSHGWLLIKMSLFAAKKIKFL